MMMNKDPDRISSVLDFLTKKLDNNPDSYEKTKEILGIETMVGERKIMFYNVKCEEFHGKSLLEYIDSENVRLSKQREELIDLSVKIANMNHKNNSEKAMEEIINNYKSGLPSGVGLRYMIDMIKEHYPWPPSKKWFMIFLSFMTCLLGIGLFAFDLKTDIEFSLELFNKTKYLEKPPDFDDFLTTNDLNFSAVKSEHEDCFVAMDSLFKEKYNRKSTDDEDYVLTAWIAIWHCIQPFCFMLIVFLIIIVTKCKGGEIPDEPESPRGKYKWLCLNSVFCCLPNLAYIGSVLPFPGLTNLYRFYLDAKCHIARSHPDFKTRIVKYEKKIRKHEALGKL